jgi:hypothetical protein
MTQAQGCLDVHFALTCLVSFVIEPHPSCYDVGVCFDKAKLIDFDNSPHNFVSKHDNKWI